MYFVAAACLIFLLYLLLIAPANAKKGQGDALWQTNYAHRGLHNKEKTVPENSLAAFAAAVNAGYGIELDINLTTDNRLVVFHDDTLRRMCGVDARVDECTYERLRELTLLNTSEHIPLFEEVLALVNGRVPLIVELKTTARNNELCRRAAQMLDGYRGLYCVESFHPAIVRWFAKHRPHVVRGQLSAGRASFENLPVWQAALLSLLVTNAVTRPNFVAYQHTDARKKLRLSLFRLMGGRLAGWTVRDTDDIAYCRKRFDTIIFEFFSP